MAKTYQLRREVCTIDGFCSDGNSVAYSDVTINTPFVFLGAVQVSIGNTDKWLFRSVPVSTLTTDPSRPLEQGVIGGVLTGNAFFGSAIRLLPDHCVLPAVAFNRVSTLSAMVDYSAFMAPKGTYRFFYGNSGNAPHSAEVYYLIEVNE
jgi:hypothetical protein